MFILGLPNLMLKKTRKTPRKLKTAMSFYRRSQRLVHINALKECVGIAVAEVQLG